MRCADANQIKIPDVSALHPLVALLASPVGNVQIAASGALRDLAENGKERAAAASVWLLVSYQSLICATQTRTESRLPMQAPHIHSSGFLHRSRPMCRRLLHRRSRAL